MGSLGITWHIWWPSYSIPCHAVPFLFFFIRPSQNIQSKENAVLFLQIKLKSSETNRKFITNGKRNRTEYVLFDRLGTNAIEMREKKFVEASVVTHEEMLHFFFMEYTLRIPHIWLQMYVIWSLCVKWGLQNRRREG